MRMTTAVRIEDSNDTEQNSSLPLPRLLLERGARCAAVDHVYPSGTRLQELYKNSVSSLVHSASSGHGTVLLSLYCANNTNETHTLLHPADGLVKQCTDDALSLCREKSTDLPTSASTTMELLALPAVSESGSSLPVDLLNGCAQMSMRHGSLNRSSTPAFSLQLQPGPTQALVRSADDVTDAIRRATSCADYNEFTNAHMFITLRLSSGGSITFVALAALPDHMPREQALAMSALSGVLLNLASGHRPRWRDSRLTRLLQRSCSPQGQLLLLANVIHGKIHARKTVAALNILSRARTGSAFIALGQDTTFYLPERKHSGVQTGSKSTAMEPSAAAGQEYMSDFTWEERKQDDESRQTSTPAAHVEESGIQNQDYTNGYEDAYNIPDRRSAHFPKRRNESVSYEDTENVSEKQDLIEKLNESRKELQSLKKLEHQQRARANSLSQELARSRKEPCTSLGAHQEYEVSTQDEDRIRSPGADRETQQSDLLKPTSSAPTDAVGQKSGHQLHSETPKLRKIEHERECLRRRTKDLLAEKNSVLAKLHKAEEELAGVREERDDLLSKITKTNAVQIGGDHGETSKSLEQQMHEMQRELERVKIDRDRLESERNEMKSEVEGAIAEAEAATNTIRSPGTASKQALTNAIKRLRQELEQAKQREAMLERQLKDAFPKKENLYRRNEKSLENVTQSGSRKFYERNIGNHAARISTDHKQNADLAWEKGSESVQEHDVAAGPQARLQREKVKFEKDLGKGNLFCNGRSSVKERQNSLETCHNAMSTEKTLSEQLDKLYEAEKTAEYSMAQRLQMLNNAKRKAIALEREKRK